MSEWDLICTPNEPALNGIENAGRNAATKHLPNVAHPHSDKPICVRPMIYSDCEFETVLNFSVLLAAAYSAEYDGGIIYEQ